MLQQRNSELRIGGMQLRFSSSNPFYSPSSPSSPLHSSPFTDKKLKSPGDSAVDGFLT